MMYQDIMRELEIASPKGHEILDAVQKHFGIKLSTIDLFFLIKISFSHPSIDDLKAELPELGVIIDATIDELANNGLIVAGEIIEPTILGDDIVKFICENYS